MVSIGEHALALPFGLPGALDARLEQHLAEEDWGAALTLLRDVVDETTVNPKWLLLLAYARFRDATEVMVEELADGARETLTLINRAMACGASHADVAPLLQAAEAALDEASREELRLASLMPEGAPLPTVAPDDLEAYAFMLWHSAPARAAALFEAHAQAVPQTALVSHARAALCLTDAGHFDEAVRASLERTFAADWSTLRRDRTVLEAVTTALLLHAPVNDFDLLWRTAEEKSRGLDLPFPSVWPNQDRLLARCLALGERRRALALAERIEQTRPEVSRQVDSLLRQARALA